MKLQGPQFLWIWGPFFSVGEPRYHLAHATHAFMSVGDYCGGWRWAGGRAGGVACPLQATADGTEASTPADKTLSLAPLSRSMSLSPAKLCGSSPSLPWVPATGHLQVPSVEYDRVFLGKNCFLCGVSGASS